MYMAGACSNIIHYRLNMLTGNTSMHLETKHILPWPKSISMQRILGLNVFEVAYSVSGLCGRKPPQFTQYSGICGSGKMDGDNLFGCCIEESNQSTCTAAWFFRPV